jgi:hypothetical protein
LEVERNWKGNKGGRKIGSRKENKKGGIKQGSNEEGSIE